MAFKLTDDGTLDTVVVCEECGGEVRFTFDGNVHPCGRKSFIEWCLKDAEEDHECVKVTEVGDEDAWGIRDGVK